MRREQQALHDFLQRTKRGVYLHCILWLLLGLWTGLHRSAPLVFWANTGFLSGVMVVRLAIAGRFDLMAEANPGMARNLMQILVFLPCLDWSLLGALAVSSPDLHPLFLPLLLTVVGLATAGTIVLCIDRTVGTFYPILALIPTGVACWLGPDPLGLLLLVMMVAVIVYVRAATQLVHDRYWAALDARDMLEERAQTFETLSTTDSLTGLPNRAAFIEALDTAVACHRSDAGAGFGVLFIDFDRFKLINDTMGHAAGDDLLRQIATRLQASVVTRPDEEMSGLAARFGGDEFAILLTGDAAVASIEAFTTRLLTALARPYDIDARTICSTASIGIVSSLQGSSNAAEIVQRADVAMYEAKHRGRGRAVVFDEPMQSHIVRRLAIEDSLRDALRTAALRLVYQPIVDLGDGTMVSAEALVRWDHPTLGTIPPNEFIPIAEESGLIVEIGRFVLREACMQFQEWHRVHPATAPQHISINLSRQELALGQDYVAFLLETIAASGIDPCCLQLEVTEREIARDLGLSLALMQSLKDTGVALAMDDFGTGASSLSCLRELPFDAIKIDQSFLASLESDKDVLTVLHATVTLIENLGMDSVAEGIERASQVAVLQSIGCRFGQGYLFSRPVAGNLLPTVECTAYQHRLERAASALP